MPSAKTASGPASIVAVGNSRIPERMGTWFFAVAAVIVMPLLPLLVEAAKNNLVIKPENLLLTTAVLAVGFGFASESNLLRASYIILFFFSIGLDFHSDDLRETGAPLKALGNVAIDTHAQSNNWLFGHPGYFVVAVCALHAMERLHWHVGQKRKFPDWVK